MKQLKVTSTDELRQIFSEFGDNVLFRGQVRHYLENGLPSVVTSFDREGCIPSKMLKWSRYASNVLDVFVASADKSLGYDQAILQHYGWRSFYVDCSASPAVASWFAGHEYSNNRQARELCEDYEERPLMLIKRYASYSFVEGEGHLYVFDKVRAAKTIGLVDLEILGVDGFKPRTQAQQAWLLGPLRNKVVPSDCFVAHITGSRKVFRDYAAEEGFAETNQLFPNSSDDPILRALLGLPWKKVPDPDGKPFIPFFRRALDLPEYHESFVKIAPPSTAFYQGATVGNFGTVDGVAYEGIVVAVPEIALFGSSDFRPLRYPKVLQLLAEHRSVVFEIDELIQHANMGGQVLYQKGVAIIAHEPNLVELSELMVEHPGLDMTAVGIVKGWYYSVDDKDGWSRVQHPEQCDCEDDRTHERHISALHIIEHFLAEPSEFED